MLPLPLVDPAALPVVFSLTVDLIGVELSLVVAAVFEVDFPVTVFVAIEPLSLITAAVPLLRSSPFLVVLPPVSFIGVASADHAALPLAAVAHKLSLISFPFAVGQSSESLAVIIAPLPIVAAAVGLDECTLSMPFSSKPVSAVCGPAYEFY